MTATLSDRIIAYDTLSGETRVGQSLGITPDQIIGHPISTFLILQSRSLSLVGPTTPFSIELFIRKLNKIMPCKERSFKMIPNIFGTISSFISFLSMDPHILKVSFFLTKLSILLVFFFVFVFVFVVVVFAVRPRPERPISGQPHPGPRPSARVLLFLTQSHIST